jgi:hypothetical protein
VTDDECHCESYYRYTCPRCRGLAAIVVPVDITPQGVARIDYPTSQVVRADTLLVK